MLLPAEVVPFLLHADADVREHALVYLAEGHDPAPATADEVWAAADRYGDEPTQYGVNERAGIMARLARFPATPRSAERLLQALRTGPLDAGVHLVRAAVELPPATLRALVADEAIRARMPAATLADLDDEVRLAAMGFDALWAALSNATAELGEDWTLGSPTHRRAYRVVRALARSPEEAAARGVEVLGGPVTRAPGEANLEMLTVEMFGRVRYPGPLDRLCRLLGEDDDYASEIAADALVHVGTPEVVATVAALARSESNEWLLTRASSVLARIRRPESEAALLRLLEAEVDLYRRTEVAMSLLDLCATSPAALGAVEQMVVAGEYDPMLVELDDLLVTVGKMVGWSPRDPAAWKARVRLTTPGLAMQAALERLGERAAATPAPRPAPRPARRGFVPYGKKAQRKKRQQKR